MANEENERIKGVASPGKPGRKISPESLKSAKRIKIPSRKSSLKEYRQAFQKIRTFKVGQASPKEREMFLEAYKDVQKKVRDAMRKYGIEEEAEKPSMDDIGQIVAAAVKRKGITSSVLDKPALNDVSEVMTAAKEVFGAEGGLRWLGTPVPALQYATPISLVETEAGRQKIHDALVNLVHGNW